MPLNVKIRARDAETSVPKDDPLTAPDTGEDYPDADTLVFNMALTIACFLAATVAVSLMLDAFGG